MPDRTITMEIEAQDIATAQRLYFWSTIRTPAMLFRIVVLWLVLCGLAAMMTKNDPQTWWRDVMIFAAIMPVAMIGFPTLMIYLFGSSAARRTLREQKTLHGPLTVCWDERGFMATNAFGQMHMTWPDLFATAENGRMFLLFESSRLFRMVPKRVLTRQQIADLHACIAAGRAT